MCLDTIFRCSFKLDFDFDIFLNILFRKIPLCLTDIRDCPGLRMTPYWRWEVCRRYIQFSRLDPKVPKAEKYVSQKGESGGNGSNVAVLVIAVLWQSVFGVFFFVAMIALSAFEFHESKGIHFSNHRY